MAVYKNQLKIYYETNNGYITQDDFDNFIHNIREHVNQEVCPAGLWIGYIPFMPKQVSDNEKLETKPVQLEFEFPDEL